jgi:LysM repeat protein
MKDPNPLLPQGSFEAQARKKSHVRIAVFTILTIHVVVLGALLIQGCKRDKDEPAVPPPAPTNDAPMIGETPPVAPPPTNPATPPVNPFAGTPNIPPVANPPVTIPPVTIPPIEPTAATEHVIAKGDTFDSLAKKYGVSAKAIQAVNPKLTPTKLQIGDKVQIPPKVSAPRNGGASISAPTGDAGVYTVASGDNLTTIAKKYHTTVKELQRLNNLGTTQIKVGQKLKVPAAAAPAPPAPSAPAPASLPGGVPAPAQ